MEAAFGFPQELLRVVLCPRDAGALQLRAGPQVGPVADGEVKCLACGCQYEIRNGILRLLPGQQPVDPVTNHEQRARDQGAQVYDAHFEQWENAVELAALLSDPDAIRGKRVLDVACGTGRLTRPFAALAGATIAADLSEESLHLLRSKIPRATKVALVWGDAVQLRFAPESFDMVLSTQLLEHLPNREKRLQVMGSAHSSLRESGIMLLTVYYQNLLRKLLRRRPEGFHAGGIFYHMFTIPEIRADAGSAFEVVDAYPLLPDRRIIGRLPPGSSWLKAERRQRVLAHLTGRLLFVRLRKLTKGDA